ncbi:TPA: DUF551 domain-containing protein, partial [Escherichia coli]
SPADVIPVYAAAPASVVPDEASGSLAYAYKELTPEIMRGHIAVFERYGIAPNDSITTIQALRIALDGIERSDAMLHGAKPVSQTYKLNKLSGNSPVTPDGWISCSERMPNDAQWCVVDAADGYYVQCWSEGQGWLGDDISLRDCDVIRWMPLPEPPRLKEL